MQWSNYDLIAVLPTQSCLAFLKWARNCIPWPDTGWHHVPLDLGFAVSSPFQMTPRRSRQKTKMADTICCHFVSNSELGTWDPRVQPHRHPGSSISLHSLYSPHKARALIWHWYDTWTVPSPPQPLWVVSHMKILHTLEIFFFFFFWNLKILFAF